MTDRPTVFISYSHKDEAWKDRFKPHLKVLEQVGHITIWDDRQIDAGAEWYDEIKKALDKAAIAVCLISADFLASDFCVKEEVPALLERRENDGMLLIPLLVRPCAWKVATWIKPIQMLPRDGKSVSKDFKDDWDTVFAEVATAIFDLVSTPGYQPPVRLTCWTPLNENYISIDRLPVTGAELFGRQKELELLDNAWDSGKTNVVSFVAWGGVGKSTLINKWLEAMKADNYRGARRVFGWSFYSQGTGEKVTSADLFIKEALKFFNDPTPEEGSPWDKGQRLADLIKKEKTLLILDGLEPLQAEHDFEKGKIKDPSLSVLVSELAKENFGLLLITTREDIPDLNEFKETTVQQNLEQISPEAGRALLRTAGVRGTDKELEDTSRSFGNQALALRLLGSYLYGEEGHLISHIAKIPDLEDVPIEKGKHPRRIMAAFEVRFGEGPAVEILRILGLFDRPVEQGAIEALLRGKTISNLTKNIRKLDRAEQKDLLSILRSLHFIAREGRHNNSKIDAHPLVREHFGEQLKTTYPEAWIKGNSRLYEYFKSQAPELPNTIEEMSPLFSAVAHGCAAGRHEEALTEVYWTRIMRGNEFFCTGKLGAVGSDLACLSYFIDSPWHTPVVGLTEESKAVVLGWAGFRLRALGRLTEAAEPMQAGLEMHIKQTNWFECAKDASNISELFLAMGKVGKAVDYAEKSVEYADKSEDAFQKMGKRTTHADALYQAGRIDDAERLFMAAEEMQKKNQPNYPRLYSFAGFRYCDLLLRKGDYQKVLERAGQTLEWAHQSKAQLLTIALDNLSLGCAHMLKALNDSGNDYSEAEKYLNKAVEGLRKSGYQDDLPRGLLARAKLYRTKKDFPKARHDLDEAMTIATRGGMKLYEADCHLEYARLYLNEGVKEKAKDHLTIAKKMVDDMGYHRRDVEVQLVHASIALADDDKTTAQEHLSEAKQIIDEKGLHGLDWEVKELEEMLGKL